MNTNFFVRAAAPFIAACFVLASVLIALPNNAAQATSSSYDLDYQKLEFLPEADLTRSNAELKVGFQRRYSNVVTIDGQAIDAVISIEGVFGHKDNEIDTFDEYDNSDQISFHTQVNGTSTDQASVRLRYQFLKGGTDTAVVLKNIRISVADIDSWEVVGFYGHSSYRLSNPTKIIVQSNGLFVSSGDGTSNTDATRIVEVTYDATSSINLFAGCRSNAVSKIGANGKCGFIITVGTNLITGASTSSTVAPILSTITYEANGSTAGTAPESTSGTGIQTIAENDAGLVRGSEVFVGWNTKADGSGLWIDPGADHVPDARLLDNNLILYAQYAAPPTPYTVTFDSNGGTGTMADQISSTTADLTPEDFTRDGYEFLGWNTAADGSGTPYVDGDTYAFNADMTLYAQWKQIPTVTFIANGGTGTMADQTSPVTADLTPKSFTRDGYVFAGWNTKADGTGELYADGASYPFTENLTLYAQWAAVEIPTTATAVATYTVTFMSNDGTGTMNPQTSAVSADISRNTFIREGYVFAGWNTAADGSGELYADEASHAFTENLTLYAQWAAVAVPPTPYTVTFLANDPSNSTTGSMSPQTAAEVTSLTPENFTREGYEFIGWNTAASGKGIAYDDEASYAFRADLTLYAQWVALPVYTVTYVANDGTGVMQPQTSSTPESLTSNIFSRDGYTFVGWNTEADGSGTPVANASTYDFSADMTLYAQWTPVPDAPPQSGPAPAPALSFTVTYFANGGDGVMQAQVSAVPLAFDRNLFTRAGFTFQGWNTDPDGSGVSYGANHIFHFESDLALYAQWLEDPVIALPEDPAPGPQALANTGDSFATGALLPLSALALALGFLLFRLGAHRNLHRNRPSIH